VGAPQARGQCPRVQAGPLITEREFYYNRGLT
jgi:hypothetical protein